MKKILWVTAIKPSKFNIGGPSGLPWEIIRQLRDMGYDVTIQMVEIHNPLLLRLSRLGFFMSKCKNRLDEYDKIMAYPDFMANYIPRKHWSKTISMGPDASSFVMARLHRIGHGWRRFLFAIYMKIQRYNEKCWMRGLDKVCVVGKNDKRWLLMQRIEKSKVVFLVHPFLSNSLIDLSSLQPVLNARKRFVFAGDLSSHYVGTFFYELLSSIQKLDEQFLILVVGKRNYWVYEVLKKAAACTVKYVSWVDDYRNICVVGRDIHCVPMLAGGGTKNRVLTALANCLEVITTPIGLENIYHEGVEGIHVCRNASAFAKKMLEINRHDVTKDEMKNLLMSRRRFRIDVDNRFRSSLGELLK